MIFVKKNLVFLGCPICSGRATDTFFKKMENPHGQRNRASVFYIYKRKSLPVAMEAGFGGLIESMFRTRQVAVTKHVMLNAKRLLALTSRCLSEYKGGTGGQGRQL